MRKIIPVLIALTQLFLTSSIGLAQGETKEGKEQSLSLYNIEDPLLLHQNKIIGQWAEGKISCARERFVYSEYGEYKHLVRQNGRWISVFNGFYQIVEQNSNNVIILVGNTNASAGVRIEFLNLTESSATMVSYDYSDSGNPDPVAVYQVIKCPPLSRDY